MLIISRVEIWISLRRLRLRASGILRLYETLENHSDYVKFTNDIMRRCKKPIEHSRQTMKRLHSVILNTKIG